MNKKTLMATIILSVFILIASVASFAKAQVPTVPNPVCEDVPGIPCPGHKSIGPLQKPQSLAVPKTGESQTFNDLLNSLNKMISGTVNQIVGGLTSVFDNAKNFFQKIKF